MSSTLYCGYLAPSDGRMEPVPRRGSPGAGSPDRRATSETTGRRATSLLSAPIHLDADHSVGRPTVATRRRRRSRSPRAGRRPNPVDERSRDATQPVSARLGRDPSEVAQLEGDSAPCPRPGVSRMSPSAPTPWRRSHTARARASPMASAVLEAERESFARAWYFRSLHQVHFSQQRGKACMVRRRSTGTQRFRGSRRNHARCRRAESSGATHGDIDRVASEQAAVEMSEQLAVAERLPRVRESPAARRERAHLATKPAAAAIVPRPMRA